MREGVILVHKQNIVLNSTGIILLLKLAVGPFETCDRLFVGEGQFFAGNPKIVRAFCEFSILPVTPSPVEMCFSQERAFGRTGDEKASCCLARLRKFVLVGPIGIGLQGCAQTLVILFQPELTQRQTDQIQQSRLRLSGNQSVQPWMAPLKFPCERDSSTTLSRACCWWTGGAVSARLFV